MAVIGLPTNDGLNQSIIAQGDAGYYIRPTRFAVSDTAGSWSMDRMPADNPPTWFTAPISGFKRVGTGTVEFVCTIPPGAANTNKQVREVQIFCEDKDGNEFFFAFGQPGDPPTTVTPLPYMNTDMLRLRLQIIISPLAIDSVFEFVYSQAQEIEDHNENPDSHPVLLALLRKYGIFMFPSEVSASGQWVDMYPQFAGIETDYVTGDVVYLNNSTKKYVKAVNPANGVPLGVVSRDDDGVRVIFGGLASSPELTANVGDKLYLDPVSAKVTATVGLVKMAISMGGSDYLVLASSAILSGNAGQVVGYGTNITEDLEFTMDTVTSGDFDAEAAGYVASVVGPITATFTINDDGELIADIA